MTMLVARNLRKRFRRTWALNDCSLEVPAGRIVALVGPNGAGKTTLMSMLVGLGHPTAGELRVAGGLIPGSPEALRAVAFVAQDTPLPERLSVADVVRLVAAWSPVFDEREARRRLNAAQVPFDQSVRSLSGGQRSQVALAVALARRPDVLILDEPLARLDPVARQDFMAVLLDDVAERGTSVLFSSHGLTELADVCDYLVVLNHGRVQLLGDCDSLVAEHRMLTGPSEEVEAIEAQVSVVRRLPGRRQTSLLVRGSGAYRAEQTPPAWQDAPISLEALVLSYLREPANVALPGPQRMEASR